jgi:glycosyltransferase involved in cell wall biosynthesis
LNTFDPSSVFRRGVPSRLDAEVGVSVVAPCYNEAMALPTFVSRAEAAARAVVGESFEIVLVNDGSTDATWPCISALSTRGDHIVGVNLSRNHGHQLAVSAGLKFARGERILIIDADLQDPPELLAEMMARMDEGHDVVYGRRRSRPGESAFKLAAAKLFYRLLHSVSDVNIPEDVGDFRLLTRRIADRLNAMPEQDRFLRGRVAWLGGSQTEVLYDRAPRAGGRSAYSLGRMIKLAVDGLTGFSTAPLKLVVVLAALGMALGAAIAIYALASFLVDRPERGWTSLAVIVVFFGVAQLGALAIIGAYVERIYMQSKGRPLYLVDEVISSPEAAHPRDD